MKRAKSDCIDNKRARSALLLWHTATATLASSPFAKSNTVRRRFSIVSTYFVRRSKIDTSQNKLQTIVARYNTPSHPSIVAQYSNHARTFPVCKEQHRATPFQHIFDQFCREHKNRHFVSRTSNARSSIQHPLPTLQSKHNTTFALAPTPCAKHSTVRRRFSKFSTYFARHPKIDKLCCKLRTLVSGQKGASCPSIIAHDNYHACHFPVYKAQHRATPFQHIFDLFCPRSKKLLPTHLSWTARVNL